MISKTAPFAKLRNAIRRPTEAVCNAGGAIDLASIMVGVLVIGIIGGVIAATVFAVVPWSQNEAAKSALGSVRTAETVAYAHIKEPSANGFQSFSELVDSKLIQTTATVGVVTNTARNCYIALSSSPTGQVFYATNDGPAVSSYVIGSTIIPGCDVSPGASTAPTSPNGGGSSAGVPDPAASAAIVDLAATGLLTTTGGSAGGGATDGTGSDAVVVSPTPGNIHFYIANHGTKPLPAGTVVNLNFNDFSYITDAVLASSSAYYGDGTQQYGWRSSLGSMTLTATGLNCPSAVSGHVDGAASYSCTTTDDLAPGSQLDLRYAVRIPSWINWGSVKISVVNPTDPTPADNSAAWGDVWSNG